MSEAAEVGVDAGPHPKAPVSWCPTCGEARWPRYGDDDAARVRRRCPTERCRGHLVSLKLHPMPAPAPRDWRRAAGVFAFGFTTSLIGQTIAWWLS